MEYTNVDKLVLKTGTESAITDALEKLRTLGVSETALTDKQIASMVIGESLEGVFEQGPWKITKNDEADFTIETAGKTYH